MRTATTTWEVEARMPVTEVGTRTDMQGRPYQPKLLTITWTWRDTGWEAWFLILSGTAILKDGTLGKSTRCEVFDTDQARHPRATPIDMAPRYVRRFHLDTFPDWTPELAAVTR